MSLNEDLSTLFAKLAAIMDIRGENTFKAIAFSKVSRILSNTTADLRQMQADGKIKELEGVGASSQKIIEEFIANGNSTDADELIASVPAGLIELLGIPSLGPKTIALLWKTCNVTSQEELLKCIDAKKLEGIKGIGEKKIESIRQGIAMRAAAGKRIAIVEAMPMGIDLVQQLRGVSGVIQAEYAGSLRRCRETIGDIDVLCSVKTPAAAAAAMDAFVKFPQVQRVLAQGQTKSSIVTVGGMQVDLRIVPQENFGAAWQYFTGSKDHNTKLRGIALDKKMTLNEWGLYKLSEYERGEKKSGQAPDAKPVASKTEQEIYTALGMKWMEPEIREDRGEIEAAVAGKLPKLIELKDIRGDLHSHTNASDGRASIAEMAEAAMKKGYEFLAVTDHSKSSVIANGLTVERLMAHIKEIHRISDSLKGIKLLAGCEVDILVDGRLDFEDKVLAELDFVVASPHVSLKQDTEKATDRILRAIDNPYVNVIGHPTGRLIHQRDGLPLNFSKVFEAAYKSGTALEINAAWPRLDLNDVHARGALQAGCKLSIDTDAHSTDGLEAMPFGVQVARRAWAGTGDVINCVKLPELRAWLKKKRPK